MPGLYQQDLQHTRIARLVAHGYKAWPFTSPFAALRNFPNEVTKYNKTWTTKNYLLIWVTRWQRRQTRAALVG